MTTIQIILSKGNSEEKTREFNLDLTKGKEFHKMTVFKGVLVDVVIKKGKKL